MTAWRCLAASERTRASPLSARRSMRAVTFRLVHVANRVTRIAPVTNMTISRALVRAQRSKSDNGVMAASMTVSFWPRRRLVRLSGRSRSGPVGRLDLRPAPGRGEGHGCGSAPADEGFSAGGWARCLGCSGWSGHLPILVFHASSVRSTGGGGPMNRPLSRAETRRVAELQLALKQIDDDINHVRAQRREAPAELNALSSTEPT